MKRIVILAQTPPPYHGQSVMVEQTIRLLKTGSFSREMEILHINLRLASRLQDLGKFSIAKIFRVIRVLARLMVIRIRGPIDTLYYVPATGIASQVIRDFVVLSIARILSRRVFFHWHGLGLDEYFATLPQPIRFLLMLPYQKHALSLILAPTHRERVAWSKPRRVEILPNFIADPCPDFDKELLPVRLSRIGTRRKLLEFTREKANEPAATPSDAQFFRVLFLGHCTRTKGLFDLMDAVEIANLKLAIQRVPLRIYLTAAGEFLSETEKQKFFARVLRSDIKPIEPSDFRQNRVEYLGYVSGEAKKKLLEQSDGLVLPTYFHTEAQPLVLIEALAYGLEIVVSDWRHLPEMLPSSARAITPKDPQALAKTLIQAACQNSALVHRRYFLETFEERKIRERIPAIFA